MTFRGGGIGLTAATMMNQSSIPYLWFKQYRLTSLMATAV